jgi:hypothetical protein
MGAVDMTGAVSVLAGALVGKYINKVLPATLNPTLLSGGKIALGLFLPGFSKSGTTKNILAGVGSGMIAVGGVELLTNLGVLQGVAEDDMLAVSVGAIDVPVLNGADDINVINGDDIVETSVLGADDLIETDVLGGVWNGEETQEIY